MVCAGCENGPAGFKMERSLSCVACRVCALKAAVEGTFPRFGSLIVVLACLAFKAILLFNPSGASPCIVPQPTCVYIMT